MTITETLYVPTRAEWRQWLQANHASAREIWLVLYKKASGKPSIPYNDAVEEALCFGWIDSTRKSIDEHAGAQRYTPRRPNAAFSQMNKERLARLREQGLLAPHIAESTAHIRPEDFVIPNDILDALRAEPAAHAFFQSTAPSYQRIRAAYVDSARDNPDEFAKRLGRLVTKCRAGKYYGFGVESYY